MTQVIQAEDLLTALAQWFDGGAEDDEAITIIVAALAAAEARGEQRAREAQCGSCETCADQETRFSRAYCHRTLTSDGVHVTMTQIPCEVLGNGCRAWRARAEKGD